MPIALLLWREVPHGADAPDVDCGRALRSAAKSAASLTVFIGNTPSIASSMPARTVFFILQVPQVPSGARGKRQFRS